MERVRHTVSALDLKVAYLQARPLNRDIFMRHPKGWCRYNGELWKLEKPAYDLAESGRFWQLCIEDWLLNYGFQTILVFPQL